MHQRKVDYHLKFIGVRRGNLTFTKVVNLAIFTSHSRGAQQLFPSYINKLPLEKYWLSFSNAYRCAIVLFSYFFFY